MKKLLMICGVSILTFCSCESDTSDPITETQEEQVPVLANLEEKTVLFDGEELTVYIDAVKGKLYAIKDGALVSVDQLSKTGNLGYYLSSDFEGFALFSSREKLDELLNSKDELFAFNQKMNLINPKTGPELESEKTSSSSSSGGGSFIVATAHSLGGIRFSMLLNVFGSPRWYANPHLRCNQYETNCYNYNDRISSLSVTNAVGEFYTGSFQNFGSWLYVNALNSQTTTIQNLSSIGWNDKITAFWVDTGFRSSRNISGFPTSLATCSHNYNDPSCSSGGSGGGSGGSGGGSGGGPVGGGGDPIK